MSCFNGQKDQNIYYEEIRAVVKLKMTNGKKDDAFFEVCVHDLISFNLTQSIQLQEDIFFIFQVSEDPENTCIFF